MFQGYEILKFESPAGCVEFMFWINSRNRLNSDVSRRSHAVVRTIREAQCSSRS